MEQHRILIDGSEWVLTSDYIKSVVAASEKLEIIESLGLLSSDDWEAIENETK